jgi:hypothetical protein
MVYRKVVCRQDFIQGSSSCIEIQSYLEKEQIFVDPVKIPQSNCTKS